MKTVLIPVQVPDWVTHFAQNADGHWRVFEIEPKEGERDWVSIGFWRHRFIFNGDPNPNWRETLREVE